MESQDYEYPVEAWLQDMEMELGNAGEYEKRLEFCNKVLEMFDWTYVAEDGFRCAVGEELYEAGKKKRKFIQTIRVRAAVGKNIKNAVVGGKHMITREKLKKLNKENLIELILEHILNMKIMKCIM